MKLYEYQGKELMKSYGIPVPHGYVCSSMEDLISLKERDDFPHAVKAQVLAGGRGKASGIRIAENYDRLLEYAGDIFKLTIKNERVGKILVEKGLKIKSERYISFTVNRSERCISCIFSASGGVDIEEVAAKTPDKIKKMNFHESSGFYPFMARTMLAGTDIATEEFKLLPDIFIRLYTLFINMDCSLAEINPLVITDEGEVFAADSKIVIDNNALYRHKNYNNYNLTTEYVELEKEAMQADLNFVKLSGEVGIIGNGAGLVMATLDMISLLGGTPANFLDIGGGANSEKVKKAVGIILKDKNVKVLFFNIFGGITRCDVVAEGIKNAFAELKIDIPVVIRLTGTNFEEGKKILEEMNFTIMSEMYEAACKAVSFLKK